MKMRFVFGVAIVLMVVVAVMAEEEKTSAVEVLTDDDFAVRTSQGAWLVKMYAPWCGHCKSLAPKWEELAGKAKDRFHVAKIDCTENKKACSGVKGYPTVRLYSPDEDEPIEYEGDRSVDGFIAFVQKNVDLDALNSEKAPAGNAEGAMTSKMLKQAQSVVKKYKKLTKTVEDLTKRLEEVVKKIEERETAEADAERRKTSRVVFLDEELWANVRTRGKWFVKFYAPWCGHCKALAPVWEELAKTHYQDYHVSEMDCTKHERLCDEMDVHSFPTLKAFKDGHIFDYEGGRTLPDFEKFAEDNNFV